MAVSSSGVGSAAAEDAETVLTTGSGVVYEAGTENVVTMVRVAPTASVPRAQGYAVVQAPLVETNVRPVGVGLFTVVSAATEGPRFVTTVV